MTGGRRIKLVRASYDAASTSSQAMRNWQNADQLSADLSLLPHIRKIISSRGRAEMCNNAWAFGILNTLADDTVGTGPRLQYYHHQDTDAIDLDAEGCLQRRERRFRLWSKKIGLSGKLRLARLAKAVDGESFLRIFINSGAPGDVKLDIAVYESEQVGSPLWGVITEWHDTGVPREVDGVIFDRYGNPTGYRFRRVHPGSNATLADDSVVIPAGQVIHYLNTIRPTQHRGFSEMAPALAIFNDLRRYSVAVVTNAESAASLTFVLQTDLPAGDAPDEFPGAPAANAADNAAGDPPPGFMDTVSLERNSGLFLPENWKANQLKAEQPTQTYPAFVDAKINEAARVFSMPFNVAKGNSSEYNYASGRLDHQTYHKKITCERQLITERILQPILAAWEDFDQVYHPDDYAICGDVDREWMWDAFEHVDPAKEANSRMVNLTSMATNLSEECAKEGRDWLNVLRQRQRELAMCKSLGIPLPPWMAGASFTSIEEEENQPKEAKNEK